MELSFRETRDLLWEQSRNHYHMKYGRFPNLTDEMEYEEMGDIHSVLCKLANLHEHKGDRNE